MEAIIGAFFGRFGFEPVDPEYFSFDEPDRFCRECYFYSFLSDRSGNAGRCTHFCRRMDCALGCCRDDGYSHSIQVYGSLDNGENFKLTRDEGRLIFGLSNAQAAATLAAVLIGYEVILGTGPDGQPIRLLNEDVLNGTIVMILITCTIASFYYPTFCSEYSLGGNER